MVVVVVVVVQHEGMSSGTSGGDGGMQSPTVVQGSPQVHFSTKQSSPPTGLQSYAVQMVQRNDTGAPPLLMVQFSFSHAACQRKAH